MQRRPRRLIHPVALWLLRPCFRYSSSREAYILRVSGHKRGPVLVRRGTQLPYWAVVPKQQ